jgi:mercuric reductase
LRTTVDVDGRAVMARIHQVMDDGRRFYEDLLEADDGALWVAATASFRNGELLVGGERAGVRAVPTIVAAGAAPAIPPLAGLDAVPFLTSADLLRLDALPTSLAIVGAGAIACEFAQAMGRLGVTVTLVLRGHRPLRGEEPEAGETVARVLRAEGVTVVAHAQGIALEPSAAGGRVVWMGGHIDAERILLATGREPAIAGLHAEEAGIEIVDGGIHVDANLRTAAPGIFAIGDVIGGEHRRYQFTHAATFDGPKAAENALAGADHRPLYNTMPRVTFTDPEVAGVGLTEAEAHDRGYRVHAHTKLIRELGKARAMGETEGFVKVILDCDTGKLLGATVVAAHAGDMLAELTIPLNQNHGELDAFLATTFAHPTLSEALKVAVRNAVTELG